MKKKTTKYTITVLTTLLLAVIFSTSYKILSNQNKENDNHQINHTEKIEEDNSKPDNENNEDSEEVSQDLESWLPRKENVQYKYEGTNNEYSDLIVIPQFNKENYYQASINNGGTTVVNIFKYNENDITKTFSRPETYFRDNFTEIGSFKQEQKEEVLLKKPIAIGTSWTSNEANHEITALNKEITVPLDTFPTIEVTSTYDDVIIKRYYAEEIGLVYEITEENDIKIESKLSEIEENTPEIISFNVFIADEQAEGLQRYETELILETNNPARLEIEKILTGKHESYINANILPKGTKINYLYLNDDNIVEVDVSKDFEDNMFQGSTGELFTIFGFINTLANYYGTDEVLLTVEEHPYEGPHILLKENETIKYDSKIISD